MVHLFPSPLAGALCPSGCPLHLYPELALGSWGLSGRTRTRAQAGPCVQLVFPSRPQSLYVCLPALLECPPFQTERRESWCSAPQLPEELRHVVSVYQATMDLLRQFRVHPEIASQMLAYLFFFSSTLLFNQLLDKGEGRGGGQRPLPLLREKPSGCWRALGAAEASHCLEVQAAGRGPGEQLLWQSGYLQEQDCPAGSAEQPWGRGGICIGLFWFLLSPHSPSGSEEGQAQKGRGLCTPGSPPCQGLGVPVPSSQGAPLGHRDVTMPCCRLVAHITSVAFLGWSGSVGRIWVGAGVLGYRCGLCIWDSVAVPALPPREGSRSRLVALEAHVWSSGLFSEVSHQGA